MRRLWLHYGLLSFVSNAILLCLAFYSLVLFDKVIASGSAENLFVLGLTGIALLTLYFFSESGRKYSIKSITQRFVRFVSFRSTKAYWWLQQAGRLNQLRSFTSTCRRYMASDFGAPFFFDAIWIPVYLLVLGLFSPLVLFVVLAATAISLGIAFLALERTASTSAAPDSTTDLLPSLSRIDNPIKRRMADFTAYAPIEANKLESIQKVFRTGVPLYVSTFISLAVISNDVTVGVMIAAGIISQRLSQFAEKAPRALRISLGLVRQWKVLREDLLKSRVAVSLLADDEKPVYEVFNYSAPNVVGNEHRLFIRELACRAGQITLVSAKNSSEAKDLFSALTLQTPGQGEINFLGRPLRQLSLAALYGEIGVMLEQPLNQNQKLRDVLFFEKNPELVRNLLARLGLEPIVYSPTMGLNASWASVVTRLSIVDARCLMLIGLLALRPRLLVLYEPLLGLGAGRALPIIEAFAQSLKQGTCILVCSTDDRFQRVAKLVYRLDKGALVPMELVQGTSDQISKGVSS